jgi:hypothetical protein
MTKVTHQMLKDFSWASKLLGNGSPFDLGPASYPRAPGDNNYGYVEGPWFCPRGGHVFASRTASFQGEIGRIPYDS